jgi:hypothetical protein
MHISDMDWRIISRKSLSDSKARDHGQQRERELLRGGATTWTFYLDKEENVHDYCFPGFDHCYELTNAVSQFSISQIGVCV